MKCPYCEIEMIHGYLNCGMTLWSTKKHTLTLVPGTDESYALHLKQAMLSPHHIESDCCPKCKRIIVDASMYRNNISKA